MSQEHRRSSPMCFFFKFKLKFFWDKAARDPSGLEAHARHSADAFTPLLVSFSHLLTKRNEILSIRSLVKVFIVPQTCCLQSRLPHCVRAQCQTNIFNAFFCLIKHLSNNSLCSNQHCLHLLVLAGGLPQSICIQSSSVSEEQDRITGGTAFAITQHTIHTTERNLLVLYNASSLETLQGICFFIYRCLHLVITCNLYKDPDTR